MSMTKSLDSVNRYLYYAITGTLRLIFRLSIQKEVYSKDSQTSQAWATSTACCVGWCSLQLRVENAGVYLDISLSNIFVPWDSIIIIKLHLLNQYIRYRVITRKVKIQGNRIQKWHQKILTIYTRILKSLPVRILWGLSWKKCGRRSENKLSERCQKGDVASSYYWLCGSMDNHKFQTEE